LPNIVQCEYIKMRMDGTVTRMRTEFITSRKKDAVVHSLQRLGYGMGHRDICGKGNEGIFLFTTESKPSLGPTQPPI